MPAKRAGKPKIEVENATSPATHHQPDDLFESLARDVSSDPSKAELVRRLMRDNPTDRLMAQVQDASEAYQRGDHDAASAMLRSALHTARELQKRAKADRQTDWDPKGDLAVYDQATDMVNAIQSVCDEIGKQHAKGIDGKLNLLLVLASIRRSSSDEKTECPAGFTPSMLAEMAGVSTATINTAAKKLGIPTPGKGESDHLYTLAESRRILEYRSKTSTQKARRHACEKALSKLPQIEKESTNRK